MRFFIAFTFVAFDLPANTLKYDTDVFRRNPILRDKESLIPMHNGIEIKLKKLNFLFHRKMYVLDFCYKHWNT